MNTNRKICIQYVFRCYFQQSTFRPQDFRTTLECETPTTKIYKFTGTMLHEKLIPLGKDNLLLRECVLKNTDYVEGIGMISQKKS